MYHCVLIGAAAAVAAVDAFAPTAGFFGKPTLASRATTVKGFAAPKARGVSGVLSLQAKNAAVTLLATVKPSVKEHLNLTTRESKVCVGKYHTCTSDSQKNVGEGIFL